MSVAASAWVRRLSLPPSGLTVLGMVDLAIAQARRGSRFAIATYLMIAASVAYVALMYSSSIGAPDAAYRDPERVSIVLVVLALWPGRPRSTTAAPWPAGAACADCGRR